jgi:hypothetical protein
LFDSVLTLGAVVVALQGAADFRGVVAVPAFIVVRVVEYTLFRVVSVSLERTKYRFECLNVELINWVVLTFVFAVYIHTHHHFIKICYSSFNS